MREDKQSRREFLGKTLAAVALAAVNPLSFFIDPKEVLAANNTYIIDLTLAKYADLSDASKHYSMWINVPKQLRTYFGTDGPDDLPYAFVVIKTSDTPRTYSALQGYCSHGLYAFEPLTPNVGPYDGKLLNCPNPDPGHGSTFTSGGIVVHEAKSGQQALEKYQTSYNAANNTVSIVIPGLTVKDGQVTISSPELYQNFPNPVTEITTIRFRLYYYSKVTLTVTDTLGHIIAVLNDGELSAGEYSFDFNSKLFPSGTYFYHLNADGVVQTKQMVVMK